MKNIPETGLPRAAVAVALDAASLDPEAPAAGGEAAREAAARGRVVVRAMLWMSVGGLALCLMNALMRVMTLELDPLYAQFLRYLFAIPMMLPMLLRSGLRAFKPNNLKGQFWRGAVHAASLTLFFLALPHLALADMTAIMFTTPIFVLLGAALVLGEKVTGERWLAALVGFGGVVVVLWPHLHGGVGAGAWSLVMLSASPLFAASFLINKALTKHDSPQVIVAWQNLSVTLFALPLALLNWQTPTWSYVGIFLVCGFLGTFAHLCMTRAFSMVDISAVQPVRFLDLIWSSLLGIALFGATPTITALAGGAVILASTIWIARRESMARRAVARN